MAKNSFNPDFKLKSIRLKNIYSFKDTTFDNIEQCCILIGRNNSGKSNLFRALNNFKILRNQKSDYFNTDSDSLKAEIEFKFSLSNEKIEEFINGMKISQTSSIDIKNFQLYFQMIPNIGSLPKNGSNVTLIEDAQLFLEKLLKNVIIRFKFKENAFSYLDFLGFEKISKINPKKKYSINFADNETSIIHPKWRRVKMGNNPSGYMLERNNTKPISIYNFNTYTEFIKNDTMKNRSQSSFPLKFYEYFLRFMHNIVYISDFRNFPPDQAIDTSFQTFKSDGSNFPQKLFELYNLSEKHENFYKLGDLLKRFYPKMWELGQDLKTERIKPYIIEENSDELRSFDLIGRGIHNLVIIITHLLEADPNSLILIEEPENHLHAKLQKTLMNVFFEHLPQSQFMITTHSTFILSEINENTKIFNVQKENGISLVKTVTSDDICKIFTELGINPGDLFAFENLIFVEGKSDRDTIETWMKTCEFNLRKKYVGIITLGGIKNYFYFASASTLKFLQDQGIKLWFLLDRDESDNEDIKKLKKLVKEFENTTLHVLQKRELENYFLKPILIAKYLLEYASEEVKKSVHFISVKDLSEEIEKKIIDHSGDFIDLVSAKYIYKDFGKSFHFQRNKIFKGYTSSKFKSKIEKRYKEIIKEIEERQTNLNKKFSDRKKEFNELLQNNNTDFIDKIPGSEFLKKILKQYGLTYDKKRDAIRFAELMEKCEIHEEIMNLLTEICQ